MKATNQAREPQAAELLDRKPPADLEAEKTLLGCLLDHPAHPDCVAMARHILPSRFTDETHVAVASAISAQVAAGAENPLDHVLLVPAMYAAFPADGFARLHQLRHGATVPANLGHYLARLTEAANRRDRRRKAIAELQSALDYRPGDMPAVPPKPLTMGDCARQYYDAERNGLIALHATGLYSLDNALGGGIGQGELAVVAARPSHGKTTFGLGLIDAWTLNGTCCALLSEEMTTLAIGRRTLQRCSVVSPECWGTAEECVLQELAEWEARRAPAYVCKPCKTIERAETGIRVLHERFGVTAFVIDYLQLLQGPGRGRYEQQTNVSIALRQLSSELGVTVVCLAQLNREIENRRQFRPQLSDLRDSGQIEQDADVILGMVWPSRIDTEADPHTMQFFVLKNRHRPICSPMVEIHFDPPRQTFTDEPGRSMAIDDWEDPYA